MAISYYGTKLSDNMRRTPEGYLVCLNAVIARSGFQIYKGSELPEDELREQNIVVNPNDDVKVLRTPEEVFKNASIASYQGKTFVVTHPDKLLNVDNNFESDCGDVINVRKGEEPLENGDWPLLADIVVKDKEAIRLIEVVGIRELSCGYNYHLLKDGNNILQVGIVGNHVALVENGRAGPLAKIQDSTPIERVTYNMSKMTSSFLRALGLQQVAKTATPEEFAVALDAAKEDEPKPKADDAKHGTGCDCATCKDAKPKGKDAKADDKRKRMHDALDRTLDSADEEQNAMDADMEELAGILQGGAGAAKTKETPGVDSEAEAEDENKEEEEEEEEEEGEAEDKAVESNASPELEVSERFGKNVPTATDKSFRDGQRSVLKALKPFVATSGNKRLVAAFDTANKVITSKAVTKSGYGKVAVAAKTLGAEAKDSINIRQKQIDDANAAYAAMRGKNNLVK
jgi:hypothetical protein